MFESCKRSPIIRNTHSTLISLWTCKEYRVLQVVVLGKGGPAWAGLSPALREAGSAVSTEGGGGPAKVAVKTVWPPEHPARTQ